MKLARHVHACLPQLCKRHLVWHDGVLLCDICGAVAGARYRVDDTMCVVLFHGFKKMKEEIEARQDTRCYGGEASAVTTKDFDNLLAEFRADMNTMHERIESALAAEPAEEDLPEEEERNHEIGSL